MYSCIRCTASKIFGLAINLDSKYTGICMANGIPDSILAADGMTNKIFRLLYLRWYSRYKIFGLPKIWTLNSKASTKCQIFGLAGKHIYLAGGVTESIYVTDGIPESICTTDGVTEIIYMANGTPKIWTLNVKVLTWLMWSQRAYVQPTECPRAYLWPTELPGTYIWLMDTENLDSKYSIKFSGCRRFFILYLCSHVSDIL